MDGILKLGPLMIATDRAVAVGLLWAFLSIAAFIASRTERRVGRVAWISALIGLIAARIDFVVEHSAAFAVEPWTALAVWQGGFSLWPGVLAASVATFILLGRQRSMVALLASILLLAGVQLGATWLLSPAPRPMPAGVVVADLNQRPIPLASLAGRAHVINLWATWCPPCRREMPMLIDVARTSDVPILLVNQGEDMAVVRNYLARQQLDGASIQLDPFAALSGAVAASAMPTTLFVDAKGQIVRAHTGEISRAALLSGMSELQRGD